MPQVAFDTLLYANKLKAVGVDPKVAELQTELQAQVLSDLTQNQHATKADTQLIRTEITEKILGLRAELKEDIHKLKNELLTKIGGIIIAGIGLLGFLITFVSHSH